MSDFFPDNIKKLICERCGNLSICVEVGGEWTCVNCLTSNEENILTFEDHIDKDVLGE